MRKGISVVVPTYNGKDLLIRTLRTLSRQTVDRSLYEVIVADDGSSDGTDSAILPFAELINLKYLYQEHKGFRAAAARNMGLREAQFETVLFIDAGILVSPRLLKAHMRCQQHDNPTAIIGTSYGVRDYSTACAEMIDNVVREDIDDALAVLSNIQEVFDSRASYLESIDYDLGRMSAPWLIFWAGHVSVPTAFLREIHGFDEWFVRWGAEDNELGIRLHQAGCSIRALREVLSIHLPHDKDPDQKRADARINAQYMHQKHGLPETNLLINHTWRCIVSGEHLQSSGKNCPCMQI